MDLTCTPEDEAFRAAVRAWLAEQLPRTKLETFAEQRAWHRTLYEAGYIGMGWPVAYGGKNARPMEQAILGEELARVAAPGGVNGLGISLVGPTLIHHGTAEQQRRYLRNILSAEEIWCQLYSEPNSGSDLASLRMRAILDDDEFIINGQKIWTSGAQHADWGLLLARTDPSAPKHLGISCLLVDLHSPGVEVRPLKQLSGAAEFNEVFFTNVRVPRENLVGELNRGWQIAQTTLSYERGGSTLGPVSRQLAQFQRLLAAAGALRRGGGRALDDPVVRQKLGQMYGEIEVLRYGALRLLSRLEKGQRPGPESSITKLYRSELDQRIQELTLEILGPFGQLIAGEPDALALEPGAAFGEPGSWAYAFARSRAATIAAGTSEVQKNIIGERVLGLPKEIRTDRIQAQRAAQAASSSGESA
ncbi:MAG TPA: acyl-CoA dehydrogenase family protein [Thermomicrobiales bacterium]|nr:acyl-CoA dehydrogenase family protein [Thermomicrobiales bacterium]